MKISATTRLVAVGLLLAAAFFSFAPPLGAESARATVSFFSTPKGAEVYLDKMRLGVTPLALWTVPPGLHTVRYQKAGFRTVQFTFRAKAGKTLKLSRTLRR